MQESKNLCMCSLHFSLWQSGSVVPDNRLPSVTLDTFYQPNPAPAYPKYPIVQNHLPKQPSSLLKTTKPPSSLPPPLPNRPLRPPRPLPPRTQLLAPRPPRLPHLLQRLDCMPREEFKHWFVPFLADDFGDPQAEEALVVPVVCIVGMGWGGCGRAAGGEIAAGWGWGRVVGGFR